MNFDLFTTSFSLAPCAFYVLVISRLAEKTFSLYFMAPLKTAYQPPVDRSS